MNLFISPLVFFADQYSKATNVTVGPDDIVVEYVTAVPNYYPPENRVKNTMARIMYDKLPVIVFYDRVSISRYVWAAMSPAISLPSDAKGNMRELLPRINQAYGLSLTPEEIEDDQYVISSSLTSVVVRLSQSCRYFLPESFTVKIGGVYEVVDDVVQHVPFDIDYHPFIYKELEVSRTGDRAVASSFHLTAKTDYTPVADILRGMYFPTQGGAIINYEGLHGVLVNALKSVDGLDWNVVSVGSPNKQSLFNAYVLYNGPTEMARGSNVLYTGVLPDFSATLDLVNPEFDNVLIMGLYWNGIAYPYTGHHQQTLSGCLFHYNNSIKKGRINENDA